MTPRTINAPIQPRKEPPTKSLSTPAAYIRKQGHETAP